MVMDVNQSGFSAARQLSFHHDEEQCDEQGGRRTSD
jgi:hypothetical protein